MHRDALTRGDNAATEDLRGGQLYVAVPDRMLIGPERVGPGSKLQVSLNPNP
jgi:hypothetical protein